MTHIIGITVAVSLAALLIWLLTPTKKTLNTGLRSPGQSIDPSDSLQVGLLIGLTGGQITDAAVAQYALRRFEEIYKRQATIQDLGTVVGLSKSIK